MAHFVQFNDVTKTYRMGETSVDALSGMSFEIDEGELVVIPVSYTQLTLPTT